MPAHKRDAIAANLTASQDPALRSLGIAACTRLTEDEAECKNGADAEALLRTNDDPTTTMTSDALANCARTQERAKAADCLVTLALRDRVEAVAIAKTSDRTPDDRYTNIAKALVAYPAAGALEKYLASLGVTPSKKGAITPIVTLYDAFVEYGRIDHFDTETGNVPNEHDALLARLAKLATPVLDGVVFEEIAPKNDVGPYSLRAYMDDKRYTLAANNNGDWYDMEAVIGLLNALAIERKSDMRFVVLPTHDQTARVFAAPALAVGQMVADGAIQIEDANAAMKDGKAFEDQVLHKLGGGSVQ
jgi:hypothetical protein